MDKNALSIMHGDLFDQAYHLKNFLIEYDDNNKNNKTCAIYFSGSGLYYPNTDEMFEEEILKKNKFEWYSNRIKGIYKHIFIRDISKQFYVIGINNAIKNMDNLIEFIRTEIQGFNVITIGSSAGGYAAAVIGSILNAKKIYCFSGFYSLEHINYDVWPLVKENAKSTSAKYYNVRNFIDNSSAEIFYFYPVLNRDLVNNDQQQASFIEGCKNVYIFRMRTENHGLAFPKYCLNKIMDLDSNALKTLNSNFKNKKSISVISFSYKVLGIKGVYYYFLNILKDFKNKRFRKTIKKFRKVFLICIIL